MPDAAGAGPDAAYQAFLDEGRFMLQRSRSSGAHVFYPRRLAPGTGADDLEWVEASGDSIGAIGGIVAYAIGIILRQAFGVVI